MKHNSCFCLPTLQGIVKTFGNKFHLFIYRRVCEREKSSMRREIRFGRVVNVCDIDESNFNISRGAFDDAESDFERSNDVQSNSQCKDVRA